MKGSEHQVDTVNMLPMLTLSTPTGRIVVMRSAEWDE